MVQISGAIATHNINGKVIRFFVVDPHDVIQSHHLRGEFYEVEELSIISEYFPRGGVYVDIGCNVGNHCIYACNFLYPSQVIIFEPNPPAAQILEINIMLNGLQSIVDQTYLGFGVSDSTATASAIIPEHNLGATRMNLVDGSGGIRLIKGDEALLQRRVDFIKMDVEGMEISALVGLAKTIAKWRPTMFIEVDQLNYNHFDEWLKYSNYSVAKTFSRYPHNTNHLVLPVERTNI